MSKAYLVLSTGESLVGERFGAAGDATGELVYNTGVVGYIELLTDPASYGQIVMQTFPLAGNYGVNAEDVLSGCSPRAFIASEWCGQPSNFRSELDLDAFLKQRGIVGLCCVDTRRLTAILRDSTQPVTAMICDEPPADNVVRSPAVPGAIEAVTTKTAYSCKAFGRQQFRVSLIDYGVTSDVIAALQSSGCTVTVLPCTTTAEAILTDTPDGVVLSDGPGDPRLNTAAIAEIAKLVGETPILAMGLGHQMLALALGGRVERLAHAHRGGQPVSLGGQVYTTSQNHGYTVQSDTLPAGQATYINTGDGTCEGMSYPELSALSVQFRPDQPDSPESGLSAGLRTTTADVYTNFTTLMGGER